MPLYHKEFVADAFLGNTTDIIAVPTTPIHGAPNKPKIKTRSRILFQHLLKIGMGRKT